MKRRILAAFAVRYAVGSRALRAAGFAPTPVFPNISLAVAERRGIHLRAAEFARAARTVGNGRLVCGAVNGLCTTIGMLKKPMFRNFAKRRISALKFDKSKV